MNDNLDDTYIATQLAGTRRRIMGYETARRTRRRGLLIAGSAVAAVALTGGTIAVVQASLTEKSVSICYSDAAPSSNQAETGATRPDGTVRPDDAMDQRVQDAEEQCAAVWSIGTFTDEGSSDGSQHPVPHLFTCVLADGRLGVFPVTAGVTCSTLELREP